MRSTMSRTIIPPLNTHSARLVILLLVPTHAITLPSLHAQPHFSATPSPFFCYHYSYPRCTPWEYSYVYFSVLVVFLNSISISSCRRRVLTTTAQVPDIAVAGFGVHAFAALRKVTTNMILSYVVILQSIFDLVLN